MRRRLGQVILLAAGIGFVLPAAADAALHGLQKNPFSRPESLRPKPPPPPAAVVVPPEKIVLDLTATVVSEIAPMVMVDGEILRIGDQIEGLKLIAVMEGKAIFARGAKRFSFEVQPRDVELKKISISR